MTVNALWFPQRREIIAGFSGLSSPHACSAETHEDRAGVSPFERSVPESRSLQNVAQQLNLHPDCHEP